MNRNTLAVMVDRALLKPEVTKAQIQALIGEAVELGTYLICVSPNQVPLQVPTGLKLCIICGFPFGAYATETKATGTHLAVTAEVDEVDMIVNLSWVKDGRREGVQASIAAMKTQVPSPKLLKVVIGSTALTDDEVVKCYQAAQAAGAGSMKTSTGFHPAGRASARTVALIHKTVGDSMGVKAPSGIRTGEQALGMVIAGTARLELSGTRKMLDAL